MPFARMKINSKEMTWASTKERFALSANTEATNLTKWNQAHSDDANRGNPLGTYQSATNPLVFTDDTNTDTGLQHIDDNWFAVYDLNADDMLGWIGSTFIPNALSVEATTTTALKEIKFGWRQHNIIAVGVLQSSPTDLFSGTPKPFFAGSSNLVLILRRCLVFAEISGTCTTGISALPCI